MIYEVKPHEIALRLGIFREIRNYKIDEIVCVDATFVMLDWKTISKV